MSKWKFDFNSAAIGVISMFAMTMWVVHSKPFVGIPYKDFEKNAKIITKVDSQKTTDWSHPVIDTTVTLPLNASSRFNHDVDYLLSQKKVKTFSR